jgi:hypothetical protein
MGWRAGHYALCSNRLYRCTIQGPSLWVNSVVSDAGVLEIENMFQILANSLEEH